MQFASFAQYLAKIELLQSRLEMTAVLAELFASLDIEEVADACNLVQGQLRPAYDSLEFQMSAKMVLRALARVASALPGAPTPQVSATTLFGEIHESETEVMTKLYKKLGDVGLVAEHVLAETKSGLILSLSVQQVYQRLYDIASISGKGSQERKLILLADLLQAVDATSAKFIARMVMGKVRLGFSTMTLLDALSWMATGAKDDAKQLELAFQKKADIGELARVYIAGFRNGKKVELSLQEYDVAVGIPVVPQLCQRLNHPEEIIQKLGKVYAEPKYDGLRVQIHITQGTCRAYSRSLEDITHMFPELELVKQQTQADSVIFDGEAIGYDAVTGELKLFQETITRKRKHDISTQATAVPIRFYIYDVLSHNGRTLLETPLHERKALLQSLFDDSPTMMHSPYIITQDAIELSDFHEKQLALGLEGLVIKKYDSPYQSGRKGWYWVKIKEKAGTQGKLTDTIDAVVMGYYLGRGKRTQFGIGAILVGVIDGDATAQDPNTQGVVLTIAKIGTGISEEQLVEIKQRCDKWQTSVKPAVYTVSKELVPDVWITPGVVVEVSADEITISKNHTAGKALRFPRLVKVRNDKKWEQATTLVELQQIEVAG